MHKNMHRAKYSLTLYLHCILTPLHPKKLRKIIAGRKDVYIKTCQEQIYTNRKSNYNNANFDLGRVCKC